MVGECVRFLFTSCEESQTHSFAALTRSFATLHNKWIKIVRTHQPWSNLCFLKPKSMNASEGTKFPWIEALRFSEYFEQFLELYGKQSRCFG